MKDSKHTPGPWKTGQTVGLRRFVLDAKGDKVAKVETFGNVGYVDGELIAAAPEMLEALESAINCLYAIRDHERENYGPMMGKVESLLISKLIPIIKKARGEK